MGRGKKARNNFSRNTRIVRAKNDGGKNRRKKVRKTFLYIHTNIVTEKWVEKTRETNFPEHTKSACKKCWEKNRRKKVRKTFFYIQKYRYQKIGGEKTRETIFPETQE